MAFAFTTTILSLIIGLILLCGFAYLVVLFAKALKKYINSSDIRKEKSDIKNLWEKFLRSIELIVI